MQPWEEIAEALGIEVKKEIADSYFSDKLTLEREWEEYKKDLKKLAKSEESLLLNACRLLLMLQSEDLMKDFEKITNFSLRECFHPQILESGYIRKKLFRDLPKPFALTSKSRFVKLFFEVYEDLVKTYRKYLKDLQDLEDRYAELKNRTMDFHKKYNLGAILSFFGRLSGSATDLGPIEEKEKIYEELGSALRIPVLEAPSEKGGQYTSPRELKEIRSALRDLAKRAYEHHQDKAKELLKIVSEKD